LNIGGDWYYCNECKSKLEKQKSELDSYLKEEVVTQLNKANPDKEDLEYDKIAKLYKKKEKLDKYIPQILQFLFIGFILLMLYLMSE
jgi:hypothetical protein